MTKNTSEYSCAYSIVACVTLTMMYVGSLYLWRSNLSRDHPTTIKKRFFSVSCMMLLAPFYIKYFVNEPLLSQDTMFETMGLRWTGFVQATVLPLCLTMILFLGPLTMQFFSGIWKLYMEPHYWTYCWRDWVWVRNHVMAPLSEEWVFRSCMTPLLLQCMEPMTAVFTGPLLFGIAHFHHMYEQIKAGFQIHTALIVSSFQFTYTSLFGAYSAYLFMRTGHFIAPLLAHMFCNHMGFPNVGEIPHHRPLHRVIIIINFIVGLVLWCYLLKPLTDPQIYGNTLSYASI